MHYTIYKITNKLDGKIYIGKHQTSDLNDGYMGSGKRLKYSINKYGKENFSKEILHVFDNEIEMNQKEAELVTEDFCKREDTYNICVGGHGGFSYINSIISNKEKSRFGRIGGLKFSTNVKLGLHNNLWKTRKSLTKEHKNKIKTSIQNKRFMGWTTNIGSKRNLETKQKMSESHAGNKNSQFGTMWITNGIENKKIKKDVDIIPEGWYKGRKYSGGHPSESNPPIV